MNKWILPIIALGMMAGLSSCSQDDDDNEPDDTNHNTTTELHTAFADFASDYDIQYLENSSNDI